MPAASGSPVSADSEMPSSSAPVGNVGQSSPAGSRNTNNRRATGSVPVTMMAVALASNGCGLVNTVTVAVGATAVKVELGVVSALPVSLPPTYAQMKYPPGGGV